MKTIVLLSSILMLGSCISPEIGTRLSAQNSLSSAANIALTNGVISTLNDVNPTAEAIAYDSTGKIIAVGTTADVLEIAGPDAIAIDLEGAQILPGFQDVHLHALEAGINENRCLLSEFGTLRQYEDEILDCASEQADDDWFIGAGVSMLELLEQTERPVDFLDEIIPDKPALILDNLGHGAWANSLALEAVGFDTLAANPQGGIIDRTRNGDPSGVVYENAQQVLRTTALPPTDANKENNYEGLKLALQILAENGITSVSDAGGYWTRGHHEAWQRLDQAGQLTVRASNALYVFPERDLAQQVADITALKYSTDLVRFDQVKIYVDGILAQGTAALKAPYERPSTIAGVSQRGFEYFSQDDLFEYARQFDAAGFSLHFHAVGDRGTALALDAIEAAQAANGVSEKRHRITHLYLVDPADMPRFSELGVVADVQMAPSSIDSATIDFYRPLIGDRADDIIATASLLSSGATVTMSSDWDADELSPLIKIEQAVLRPNQAIPDVLTAIRMMTIEPAKLLGHEDITGTLEVGKHADLVILDQDILSVPLTEIDETEIIATVMDGTAVYDPEQLF